MRTWLTDTQLEAAAVAAETWPLISVICTASSWWAIRRGGTVYAYGSPEVAAARAGGLDLQPTDAVEAAGDAPTRVEGPDAEIERGELARIWSYYHPRRPTSLPGLEGYSWAIDRGHGAVVAAAFRAAKRGGKR